MAHSLASTDVETAGVETGDAETGGRGTPSRCRFVVLQTEAGRWRAVDRRRCVARDFATRREAIHFALFEAGSTRAAVLLTPER